MSVLESGLADMDDEPVQPQDGRFVSVYEAKDEVTANIVKATLEAAGITAIVEPHHTSWFDGIFVPAEGSWGRVLVPEENIEMATKLLREYENTKVEDD